MASGSSGGWAWVAVRDQGPGIAEEEQQRVFDRFRRAQNGGRRGTGLGLAIARQIVESHEGKLTVFSTLGVGSTFVIWLPDRAIADRPERTDQPPTHCPF
jgi:signal transduction histidine kinase